MADQVAPYYHPETGDWIGYQRIVAGHVMVTDQDDQVALAGMTPEGEVVNGAEIVARLEAIQAAEDEAAELDARLDAIEQQMAADDAELEYEDEYQYEDEGALTDEEMRDLEWAERFRAELGAWEHEHGRPPTDRQLHELMAAHYAQFQADPEQANIWRAALEIHQPDLDTHQGRADHGVELLEDADRARRGIEFDPRGERAATSYDRSTPEGRAAFGADRIHGFIDEHGQSIDERGQPLDAVPAGDIAE